MTARRSMLSLCAVFALSGCLEVENARANNEAQTTRAKFYASAISSYAFTRAAVAGPAGIVSEAPEARAASILCPFYDGTRDALFLSWPTVTLGVGAADVAAEVTAMMGAKAVAKAKRGPLMIEGRDVSALPGCELPALEPETPIVGVKVQVQAPATMAETARQELEAENCPAGMAGTIVRKRTVIYSTEAPPIYGDWETASIGSCLPVADITTVETIVPVQPWTKGGTTAIDRELEANSPTSCKRVNVKGSFNGEASQYTVDTCQDVELPRPVFTVPTTTPDDYPVLVQCFFWSAPGKQGTRPDLKARGFNLMRSGHSANGYLSWYAAGSMADWAAGKVTEETAPCEVWDPTRDRRCTYQGNSTYNCNLR